MQRTFRCDPIQVSQWKRQLLDGASELFTRGKKSKDKEEGQAKEAELFQQIGLLQMELEWLKKRLSCSDARELRKLVDHDHPEISVSRQCALLGLSRSTLYYQPTPVRESTRLHIGLLIHTGWDALAEQVEQRGLFAGGRGGQQLGSRRGSCWQTCDRFGPIY